ncbi:hypothetical protein HRI_004544400 [Hibiscus trionum]|uniref:Reverse transcriptase domain-containing protein n=1 Tax=Hibiscus trionum TaxID=183268 RepID=A0A9W7J607_HIBTR|nr:hypothetical protein HRI_004544400 [Hibiscus trionum]
MVNFLFWNIQGAAGSSFRDHLRRIRSSSKPSVVTLLETRISGIRDDCIISRLGFQSSFWVEAQGFSGGIWLLWNGDMTVQILAISNQFIHFSLHGLSLARPLLLTVVYANSHIQYMRFLWDQLSAIKPRDNQQWLIGGHLDDHHGGQTRRHCVSKDFQGFVFTNALLEVDFKGPRFTWVRGDLYERLDRCLVNMACSDTYSNTLVNHLDRIDSDHRPLLLSTDPLASKLGERPFRFVPACQDSAEFVAVLKNSWEEGLSYSENIGRLCVILAQWNSQCKGDMAKKKKRILARLRGIDKALGRRHSTTLSDLENSLKQELDDILAMEESLWRQKSRCDWIRDGDRNTSYYHAIANGRRKRNTILSLKDDCGNWILDPEKLKMLAVDFFETLFSSEGNNGYSFNCREQFRRIDQQNWEDLIRPLSCEEIREALFQMHPSKSPGVDGFHASFYQRNWDIVGKVVCNTIQCIFASGVVDPELNKTLLVLIPKVEVPETIAQFRPIGLCTVMYKILSKIVVNRLKPYLPGWVSENQTSFVPGRSIIDNVIVAQEIIHSMRSKKGKAGWFAIKVDLEKAYDRLEWSFIDDTLVDIGILVHLRHLIMSCVSSVSTQIFWNGSPTTSFRPSRGIRQGDPLSPYLFILCMERLTQSIQREVDQGSWKAFRFKRKGSLISHLFFADDLILFAEASFHQFDVVSRVLREFCECSGHKVGISKTNIFFSHNIHASLREDISGAFGFQCVDDLGRYLGVPLLHGRITKNTYRYLIQRVADKLTGWKARMLSFAGRIVLAKSVLAAIPMYAMQSVRLPKYVYTEIDRLIRNFIWGHCGDSRVNHVVNWDVVYSPIANGGLGLKKLEYQNEAFLMKLGFVMISEPNHLWVRILRCKYGIQDETPTTLPIRRGSHLWSGITLIWPDLVRNLVWNLGDGHRVDFWRDAWVDSFGPLCRYLCPRGDADDRNTSVRSMVTQDGQWNWGAFAEVLPSVVLQGILAIKPPFVPSFPDSPGWSLESNRRFTVRSAYRLRANSSTVPSDPILKVLTCFRGLPRIKSFLWQVCHGRIMTNAERVYRHIANHPSCMICGAAVEDISHVLRDCLAVRGVWLQLVKPDRISDFFQFQC